MTNTRLARSRKGLTLQSDEPSPHPCLLACQEQSGRADSRNTALCPEAESDAINTINGAETDCSQILAPSPEPPVTEKRLTLTEALASSASPSVERPKPKYTSGWLADSNEVISFQAVPSQ